MRGRAVAGALTGAAVGLLPTAAEAHLVSTRFGDFYGGILHPVTSLEHLLPWVALGLLAGLQEVRVGRAVPLVFTAGVAIGVVSAVVAPAETRVAGLPLASFILLGGLVAFGRHWPAPLLSGLAGLVGLLHGYDNGLAVTPATNVLLFASGVVTCGLVLVLLVTATTVAAVRSRDWTRIAVRALGSWIAAAGVMVAGLALTG